MKLTEFRKLIREEVRRVVKESSRDDFDGTGLIVQGRTQIDNNEISDFVDASDYHGVWNAKEGYWFFPEDEETLDDLEMELSREFDNRGINYRIEGQFNESLKETDLNDPVLMKLRAQKSQSQSKQVPQSSLSPKILNKIKFLEKEREQLMFDMEQEAELEGGPIADMYGEKLNRIDKAINKLKGYSESVIHIPNLSWQDQTRIMKWLNQQDYDLKDYKVIEKGDDITIDTYGLDRSETKEIESYLKSQNYKFSSNL